MGVLQNFDRRLEGAVEGFFARAFRSGLQPVELAKALQRYGADHQHVVADGVVTPNEFAVTISPEDHDRLATYTNLTDELVRVVEDTADERGWLLRGPVVVAIDADPDVRLGRHVVTGRVHGDAPAATPAAVTTPAVATPVVAPTAGPPRLEGVDRPVSLTLDQPRLTIGRLPTCALVLDDDTISRNHAVVVRRDQSWWILDQGSTNGTRVNGTRAAESALRPGDRVELGDVTLVFHGGD